MEVIMILWNRWPAPQEKEREWWREKWLERWSYRLSAMVLPVVYVVVCGLVVWGVNR